MNPLIIIFAILLGASIGSFINAAVYRVAKHQSVIKGRSRCVKCGQILAWYDLIPIFSYLILRGKCRQCDKSISIQYILVEIVMGSLFVVAFYFRLPVIEISNTEALLLLRDLFAVSVLVFLFVFDLRYYLLPDIVTIPATIIILILSLLIGVPWWSLLVAVAIGAGFFALQFVVSKGKWIGGGDIRFGALMGALLAWPNILVGLFFAYLIGAIVGGLLLAIGRKKMGSQLPFGTFLAIGTTIGLWWGNGIINIYLGLM